jgi:hypothetical protein
MTTQNDSSTVDTGTTGGDDGGTQDTGTVTQGDTGTVVNNGDSSTGDAGTCSALASVPNPQTFTNVTQQSVCTSAQISAGVAACFGGGTTCATWQAANAACAACAIPPPTADGGTPPNSGGLLCVDALGECFANIDGCIQIEDKNATCATADENLSLCAYAACASPACLADLQSSAMAAQTDYNNCFDAAQQLACATQVTAWQTACATDYADGGTESQCTAGATSTDVAIHVLNVICNGNNM